MADCPKCKGKDTIVLPPLMELKDGTPLKCRACGETTPAQIRGKSGENLKSVQEAVANLKNRLRRK